MLDNRVQESMLALNSRWLLAYFCHPYSWAAFDLEGTKWILGRKKMRTRSMVAAA